MYFTAIDKAYNSFNQRLNKEHTKVPNVKGMDGMDAISLLENIGLKVSVQGFGKVQNQSIKKGVLLQKGATITLKLS